VVQRVHAGKVAVNEQDQAPAYKTRRLALLSVDDPSIDRRVLLIWHLVLLALRVNSDEFRRQPLKRDGGFPRPLLQKRSAAAP
jgi:hypothetical protein